VENLLINFPRRYEDGYGVGVMLNLIIRCAAVTPSAVEGSIK